jgi:octaprenyl-diphosphate synthase
VNIFTTIRGTYSNHFNLIDDILINRTKGKSELANKIIENLVSFKGKRIRPLLVIIANEILGNINGNNDYLKIAAAIELLHNATLLHDDVIDDSKLRRGRKTANYEWGNKAGILSGDLLLATSFQIIIEVGQMDILKSIANASKVMSNGEISQLSNIGNINLSKEQYLEVIYAKTAILFSVATEAGAILSGGDKEKILSLKDFGKNLGMAFQIMDDILDYDSNKNKIGKNIADDFIEGKVTIPIILLKDVCDDGEKIFLKNIFDVNYDRSLNKGDFDKVNSMISKYNIISKSQDLANYYVNMAQENLSSFSNSCHKDNALSILNYVLNQN